MIIFAIDRNELASKTTSPKFKNKLKFFDMTKVFKSSPTSKRGGVKKQLIIHIYLHIRYIQLLT
jgi:hypothetical protein